MRTLFVVLLLGGCAAQEAALKKDLACLEQTLTQAKNGDFHDIVLPKFVPVEHLSAGQISSCMR